MMLGTFAGHPLQAVVDPPRDEQGAQAQGQGGDRKISAQIRFKPRAGAMPLHHGDRRGYDEGNKVDRHGAEAVAWGARFYVVAENKQHGRRVHGE